MKIMDNIEHFLSNSFGYIGKNKSMPERTTGERIGGVGALAVLTFLSFGLFLALETVAYFYSKNVKADPSCTTSKGVDQASRQVLKKET